MSRICHLTVLDPALHSRIFYKEAQSQAAAGHRVTVIGQGEAAEPYEQGGVRIVPTGIFGRMSRKRIFSNQFILPLAEAERADVYHIHSPELLRVGRELKVARPNTKLIYDVHEDYAANIQAGTHFPNWAKRPLVAWLKRQEREFANYGDGLVYAEDCYRDLVDFDAGYTAFVRNKFKRPEKTHSNPIFPTLDKPYLLYTGTISEPWGIFKTLDLWEELNVLRPMDLVVAGHTRIPGLLEELELVADCCDVAGRLHIFGGRDYLPYEKIVALIEGCWAGTALYEVLPHIENKVPTKFFEFMGCGKPLFFSKNPSWEALNEKYPFGWAVEGEMERSKLEKCAIAIDEGVFSTGGLPKDVWGWEGEERTLLDLLEKVLG